MKNVISFRSFILMLVSVFMTTESAVSQTHEADLATNNSNLNYHPQTMQVKMSEVLTGSLSVGFGAGHLATYTFFDPQMGSYRLDGSSNVLNRSANSVSYVNSGMTKRYNWYAKGRINLEYSIIYSPQMTKAAELIQELTLFHPEFPLPVDLEDANGDGIVDVADFLARLMPNKYEAIDSENEADVMVALVATENEREAAEKFAQEYADAFNDEVEGAQKIYLNSVLPKLEYELRFSSCPLVYDVTDPSEGRLNDGGPIGIMNQSRERTQGNAQQILAVMLGNSQECRVEIRRMGENDFKTVNLKNYPIEPSVDLPLNLPTAFASSWKTGRRFTLPTR